MKMNDSEAGYGVISIINHRVIGRARYFYRKEP